MKCTTPLSAAGEEVNETFSSSGSDDQQPGIKIQCRGQTRVSKSRSILITSETLDTNLAVTLCPVRQLKLEHAKVSDKGLAREKCPGQVRNGYRLGAL